MTSGSTCGRSAAFWQSCTPATRFTPARTRSSSWLALWRCAGCHRPRSWRVRRGSRCSSTPTATRAWCPTREARPGGPAPRTCRWLFGHLSPSTWTSCRGACSGTRRSACHRKMLFSRSGSSRATPGTRRSALPPPPAPPSGVAHRRAAAAAATSAGVAQAALALACHHRRSPPPRGIARASAARVLAARASPARAPSATRAWAAPTEAPPLRSGKAATHSCFRRSRPAAAAYHTRPPPQAAASRRKSPRSATEAPLVEALVLALAAASRVLLEAFPAPLEAWRRPTPSAWETRAAWRAWEAKDNNRTAPGWSRIPSRTHRTFETEPKPRIAKFAEARSFHALLERRLYECDGAGRPGNRPSPWRCLHSL
mmetsp:Transcript_77581/g.197147  ORF Transcript_77581/g.197147 Transcript_77581/m.197147 type:complete len:370 (+) Transcript_77581:334-1443(+)